MSAPRGACRRERRDEDRRRLRSRPRPRAQMGRKDTGRKDRRASARIGVICALAAMGALATNILLPSLPAMAVDLHVSSAAVTSAVSAFLAILALAQLIVGPFSDRFGRRAPILCGLCVILLWTACARSPQTFRTCWSAARFRACGVRRHGAFAAIASISSRAGASLRHGLDQHRHRRRPRSFAPARQHSRSRLRLAIGVRLHRDLCGLRACRPRGADRRDQQVRRRFGELRGRPRLPAPDPRRAVRGFGAPPAC